MSNIIDFLSYKRKLGVMFLSTEGLLKSSPLIAYNKLMKNLKLRYPEKKIPSSLVTTNNFDSYIEGCTHNSVFQWHPTAYNATTKKWNSPIPFPVDLRKAFKLIHNNKKLVLGVKSDPFMWLDNKYCITKKIIRYANRCRTSLEINTMSDLCAQEEYIKLLLIGGHTINMLMSSPHCTEHLERLLSPGTPSIHRRQLAIEKLRRLGVSVKIVYKPIPLTIAVSRRLGLGFEEIKKLNNGISITQPAIMPKNLGVKNV